jgi:Holliday junction resolvasome RuvABC endonuclease subunit
VADFETTTRLRWDVTDALALAIAGAHQLMVTSRRV